VTTVKLTTAQPTLHFILNLHDYFLRFAFIPLAPVVLLTYLLRPAPLISWLSAASPEFQVRTNARFRANRWSTTTQVEVIVRLQVAHAHRPNRCPLARQPC